MRKTIKKNMRTIVDTTAHFSVLSFVLSLGAVVILSSMKMDYAVALAICGCSFIYFWVMVAVSWIEDAI